jgi:hypothetical protein
MVWKHVFSHVNTLSVPYIWGGDRFPALHLGGRWCCETAECTELKSESEEVLKRKYVWYQVTEEDKILQDQYFGSLVDFDLRNWMEWLKQTKHIRGAHCGRLLHIPASPVGSAHNAEATVGQEGDEARKCTLQKFHSTKYIQVPHNKIRTLRKAQRISKSWKENKRNMRAVGHWILIHMLKWCKCVRRYRRNFKSVATLSCYMLLHSYSKWTHCFSMFFSIGSNMCNCAMIILRQTQRYGGASTQQTKISVFFDSCCTFCAPSTSHPSCINCLFGFFVWVHFLPALLHRLLNGSEWQVATEIRLYGFIHVVFHRYMSLK